MNFKSTQDINLQRVRDYAILVLFFVIPLYRSLSTIAIVSIVLLSLIDSFRKKSFPKIQLNWFLPALFCYYLLSNLFSGGSGSAIERALLLLVVPVMFALNLNFYEQGLRKKIYLSYILGIVTAETICVVRAVYNSLSLTNGHLVFNPKVFPDSDYDFLTASIRDGNYFFGQDFSLFLHPIYFGLYIVFGQYLIVEVFRSSQSKWTKRLLILCFLLQFLFLFLLSSKGAMIGSLLLLFALIIGIKTPGYTKGVAILGLSVLIASFFFLNPRMKEFRKTFITRLSINPNARFGHDLRILSWDASLEVIKNNWLMGVGEGKKESALMAVYEEKGYIFPAKNKLNSHNQYLDFLIGGGIIGFGIFMIGLVMLLYRSWNQKNFQLLIFLLLFSYTALFENLLYRHAGIIFFALFITLLETTKRNSDIRKSELN